MPSHRLALKVRGWPLKIKSAARNAVHITATSTVKCAALKAQEGPPRAARPRGASGTVGTLYTVLATQQFGCE